MVEQSFEPIVGKVVITTINCEMTVKRLSIVDGQMTLTADNRDYIGLEVDDFEESIIFGSDHQRDLNFLKLLNFKYKYCT